MQAYPLLRIKWSNEHIMTVLIGILILYMLPGFINNPKEILSYLVLLLTALIIDSFFNFLRHKQLLCSVSAAVTSAILQILTPDVPLYIRILGIIAALIIGKHVWGGTGKNPINPALTGIVLICFLFPVTASVFKSGVILIPAILLSLPFIIFRPFAATGFIAGMTAAIILSGNIGISEFVSIGVFFWGCIILTDPVTITSNPLIGGIIGLVGGFVAFQFSNDVFFISVIVLFINIISAMFAELEKKMLFKQFFFFIPKKIKPYLKLNSKFYDLTGEENQKLNEINNNSNQEILERIGKNDVFGFGGAGFPTVKKIKTVIESDISDRHLIINAVECDPGLLQDKWLLRNKLKEISLGIEVLCKCIKFDTVTIAVKENKGFPYLQNGYKQNFILKQVPDYFPVGAEKFLIKEVLLKYFNETIIPAKEGVLVLNLQTIYAVYEAVFNDKKAETRFITVANIKEKTGYVVKVKLGTQIQTIIDSIIPQGGILFSGGGIMQSHNVSATDVIDKNTNFIAVSDFPRFKESLNCSLCGFCKINCPSGLLVNKISDLVDKGNLKDTRIFNPKSCIQCGRCSSVCLAGRNLSNRMKIAKEYSISTN